jgi:hypothetical protein
MALKDSVLDDTHLAADGGSVRKSRVRPQQHGRFIGGI